MNPSPWARPTALLLLPLGLAAGCGSPASPVAATPVAPPAVPSPAPPPSILTAATCDGPAILAKHAAAFGSEAALRSELPRTLAGTLESDGQPGVIEMVLAAEGHRVETRIGSMYGAEGVGAHGPWQVASAGGSPLALGPGEASAVLVEGWLARRTYLSQFDPARDAVHCDATTGRTTLEVRIPDLGSPALAFDVGGALLEASWDSPDGRRQTERYRHWSNPDDAGVRWPDESETLDPVADPVITRFTSTSTGLSCKGVDPRVPSSRDCLAETTAPLVVEWPASGIVRVPMRYRGHELLLPVKVGERTAWALLDTGASLSAIDAGSKTAQAFTPGVEIVGSAATQRVRVGIGELETLRVGDLVLRHLPVASVPMPVLDGMGDPRPEVIVGLSVFLAGAVRIDYARGEVVLTRSPARATSATAVAIPLRYGDDELVVDATFGGIAAPFQLDTGDSGGFDLTRRWADAQGLPGAAPTLSYHGRSGAGTEASTTRMFREATASLGPLHHDRRLARIQDAPNQNAIAGLVGNEVLSRCPAIVVDVPARTLWLEGPCDRPSPESLAGWRLARKDDPAVKAPWIVESVLSGGAAEAAGVQPGDRLLTVRGRPATLDVARLEEVTDGPVGATVPITVHRGTETKSLVMTLAPVLALRRE